jgi:hypothetical protein
LKDILVKIMLLAICVALIIGVVIPLAGQIRETGQNAFNTVKNLDSNITP